MSTTIEGTVFLFGDHIDTDQIYPGRYLELTDPTQIASHVFEGADAGFLDRYKPGGIIVAGRNFGCGSSREHAAIALQSAGIPLVIAESFARIFYRNCINLGLPLLICAGITAAMKEGDTILVDLKEGIVLHKTKGLTLKGQGLSEDVWAILEAGGIKPLLRRKIQSRE